MNIVCINSRDELNLIDLDLIACVQANGNYSNVMYIDGYKTMVSLGLSHVEEIIRHNMSRKEKENPYVRLGRSIIVNSRYLSQINLLQQRLTLSDGGKHCYQLNVPKHILREYKDLIRKQFNI